MKGHVTKKGNKWYFVVDTGKDPITGRRKQKWFSGYRTKKEAEKAMIAKIHEIGQGKYIEPSKITLKDFLIRWLRDYTRIAIKGTTYDSYSGYIHNQIIPSIGNITLDKLQATHLQQFYTEKLQNGRKDGKGGLSPATVRTLHSIIRSALSHAVKWQLLNNNVAELADPPAISRKETTTWTKQDVKKFLAHAKNDPLYIAFILAITTGLRRGEILGLRWKDIDFDNQTANIRKNLVVIKGKLVLQDTKTRGSQRSVSLPNTAIEALRKHKIQQYQQKLKKGENYRDQGLVTTTRFGTPIGPRNLLRSFYRIIEQNHLTKIRFHDIRHTHATLMLQQGEHPKIVSERLGHSNTRVTLDIYSHVLPNMQKEAADRFEEVFLK